MRPRKKSGLSAVRRALGRVHARRRARALKRRGRRKRGGKKRVALAGASLLYMTSTCIAGLTFATGTPTFAPGRNSGTALTATNLANAAGAPNGTSLTVSGIDYASGFGDRFTVTFAFAPGTANQPFIIWTGNFTGAVNLTAVSWNGAAAGAKEVNVVMTSSGVAGTFFKNTVSGVTWSTDFTQIVLTFTARSTNGTGKNFRIDAISNPEPATIALFAVGLAGLAGFSWRKRRRRGAAPPDPSHSARKRRSSDSTVAPAA